MTSADSGAFLLEIIIVVSKHVPNWASSSSGTSDLFELLAV